MQFGVSVWRGDGNVNDAVRRSSDLGFDFVEIDLESLSPSDLAGLRAPLPFGFHAPPSFHLSHVYTSVERAMLRQLMQLKSFASTAGAAYLNVHPYYPSSSSHPQFKSLNAILFDRLVRNVRTLVSKHERLTTTVENLPNRRFCTEQFFARLLRDTGAKLCLDVGHIALLAFRETGSRNAVSREIARWFTKFRGKILLCHVHNVLADQKGIAKDHRLRGLLDLDEVAELAEASGCEMILLEVFYRDMKGTAASLKEKAHVVKELRKVVG